MKLKRNKEVALKVWINDSVFADETWTAMTAVDEDSAYVLIKDPGSPNTLKIKITQYSKVEGEPEPEATEAETVETAEEDSDEEVEGLSDEAEEGA